MNLIIVIFIINLTFLSIALINFLTAPRVGKTAFTQSNFQLPDKVSVLIPCRNEELNISTLLNDLKNIQQGILEILVYDDDSDDNTARITERCATTDSRIRLIYGKKKPEKWMGKSYACDQLSRNASGKYILFIDADVRISAYGFLSMYKEVENRNLDLLTVFPSQLCLTTGEKIVVPVMHRVLLTLLPLFLMQQKRFSSLSAANGQVMFFRTITYNTYKLHQRFNSTVVEDIAIVRFLKREKLNAMCFLGNGYICCRMYNSYQGAINGFAKNAVHFFGGSYLTGLLYAFTGILSYTAIYLTLSWHIALLFLFTIHLFTEILIASSANTPVFSALLHYPLRGFVLMHILYISYIQKIKKTALWKGRKIYF